MAEPELSSLVKLTFRDEAARRAFMMKVITLPELTYKLDNGVSVLLPKPQAERLGTLAADFGAVAEQPLSGDANRKKQAHSHDERVESWDNLMAELEAEVQASPYALSPR